MQKTLVLLCLSLLMISAIASDDQTSEAWNRFYSSFSESIGGDPKGITFMTTPYALTNIPTTGAFQIFSLCNSVPNWSFSYLPKGDVYGGYTEFANSLFYEVNTQAYQKAVAQQVVVQNNIRSLNQCFQGLTAEWLNIQKTQVSVPQPWTYDRWYDQIGQYICKTQQDLWRISVQQYDELLMAAMINGYSYVFQAQSGLNNPANYMSVFDGTNIRNVSICTTSPDLQSTYTNWLNKQLNPGSFSLSSKTSTSNEWEFGAKGGINAFFHPISINAGGEYDRVEIDTSSNEFSMTVSWEGLQQLQFSRGNWYNGALVQGHMYGPFSSSSAIGQGHTKLWGDDGMLGLIPSTAIVIYKPKIEISLSQNDYKKVRSSWKVDATSCVFIFCFDAESHGKSTSITFNDNSFSFTISDNSDIPKVVAIVNNVNQDDDDDEKKNLNLVPFTKDPSISLDINSFKSLSGNSVQFSVSRDAITVKGDSSCFSGEMKISSIPNVIGVEKIHCNDNTPGPNLSNDQIQCIKRSLKSDTTSSSEWNFYFRDHKTKDLAHFTTNKKGGAAHFTCRADSTHSGHHCAANKKVTKKWLEMGCCKYSDSIKKHMDEILEKVAHCI